MSLSSSSGTNEAIAGAPTGHQFWSVDSAPARLTRPLPLWGAPVVLAVFLAMSTALLFAVNRVPALVEAFPNRDFVFSPYIGTHSIPLRIFIVSFYVAFSTMFGSTLWGKIRFFLELMLYYVLVVGALDAINIIGFRLTGFVYSLHVIEILSGLIGFFVFSAKLLDHGSMAARAEAPFSRRFKLVSLVRLTVAVIVSIAVAVGVDRLELPLVFDLRNVALLGGTGPGVVNDDLTFELKSRPGKMKLAFAGQAPGWTIRTVRYRGVDVTDTGIEFRPNENITEIELELTNRVTDLSGVVTNSKGEALKDYSVIIFAQDREKWMPGSRFLRSGRPDQDGRFKLSALPPGDYYVMALDYLDQDAWTEPEYLERVRNRATSVSINEGETKTVDLKVTTAS